MSEEKYPLTEVTVRLIGVDGNAFNLIGLTREALWRGGHAALIEQFMREATSGDYSNVIATIMRYCHVE